MFSDGVGFEADTGGIQSSETCEKPPVSASDITLHAFTESGSWKVVRMKGAVGTLVPSAVRAMDLEHQPMSKNELP